MYVIMEKKEKISQNYHSILLSKSSAGSMNNWSRYVNCLAFWVKISADDILLYFVFLF